MGITGLIPFLEKASKKGNISQFSGGTVAVDTYCWLHRGAFACADKLAMGQPSDAYVRYCMKLVHMLLSNRIKPILVFDGRHLPAKADTEVKRRESRETNKRRAAELIKIGKSYEGKNLLRRSVDISHEMALELIKQCQDINVDCIVAPFEADAQLAYLNIKGFVDVVITEDSDLTLFGCKKVFFKMDINGNGLLVEQSRFHLAMSIRPDFFDMDKFRYMCILSGCDYLPSLPGIGLSKALKFIKNSESDILKSLPRLGSYLKMKSLIVTKEYCEGFIRAFITFKHQLVYCPSKRKQVRLYDVPPEVTEEQLYHAGKEVEENLAFQLALGNYHPLTFKKLHEFNPDLKIQPRKKTNSWHETSHANHLSIWSTDFKLNTKTDEIIEKDESTKWPNTVGNVMVLKTTSLKKNITPVKRTFDDMNNELNNDDLKKLYGNSEIQTNEIIEEEKITKKVKENVTEETEVIISSPYRQKNKFIKNSKSPCLIRPQRKLLTTIAVQPTIIDESVQTTSKFFSSDNPINNSTSDEKTEDYSLDLIKKTDESISTVIMTNIHDNDLPILNKKTEKLTPRVIIPETLDDNLPISQPDEYKENANNFTLNKQKNNLLLRTDSGVDLKEDSNDKSNNSDVEKFEDSQETKTSSVENSNISDLNCFQNLNCDVDNKSSEDEAREPSPEVISEFESNVQHTDSLRSSFFKWSNPKNVKNLNSFNNNRSQVSSQKPSNSQNKSRVSKRSVTKKSSPLDSQQSLLNMFGFKKKALMKD